MHLKLINPELIHKRRIYLGFKDKLRHAKNSGDASIAMLLTLIHKMTTVKTVTRREEMYLNLP